jgi:hypothetical protein
MQKQANKYTPAGKLFNTLFNPFALPGDIYTIGDPADKSKAAVSHAATLTAGIGGLAYLAKRLSDRRKSRHDRGLYGDLEQDAQLRSLINAQFPIISYDPNLRDAEQERKQEALGVERSLNPLPPGFLEKESAANPIKDIVQIAGSPVKLLQKWVQEGGNFSPMHPALALTAATAALYGGYRVARQQTKRDQSKALDSRISDLQNETDALAYEELKEQGRLPQKTAASDGMTVYNRTSRPRDYREDDPAGSSALGLVDQVFRNPKGGVSAMMALVGLASVGMAAVSYRGTRNYMDKTDPNRQKMKDLRNYFRKKALVRRPPVLMPMGIYQDATPAEVKDTSKDQRKLSTRSSSLTPEEESALLLNR